MEQQILTQEQSLKKLHLLLRHQLLRKNKRPTRKPKDRFAIKVKEHRALTIEDFNKELQDHNLEQGKEYTVEEIEKTFDKEYIENNPILKDVLHVAKTLGVKVEFKHSENKIDGGQYQDGKNNIICYTRR